MRTVRPGALLPWLRPLLLLALLLAALPARAHITPEALDEAIHAYLLDHPEVILESVQRYQQEQELAAAEAEQEMRRAYLLDHRAEVFDDGHSVVLGNPEGDLTLVEWFDYRCGFCRRALPEVLALLAADGGIRLVLKEFPILGEESVAAARGSIAASRLDRGERFLALHMGLMQERGPLTEARVLDLAVQAGFDRDRMRAELADDGIDELIRQNREQALELGIDGTPAFILGDEVMPGYMPGAELLAWAERVRSGS